MPWRLFLLRGEKSHIPKTRLSSVLSHFGAVAISPRQPATSIMFRLSSSGTHAHSCYTFAARLLIVYMYFGTVLSRAIEGCISPGKAVGIDGGLHNYAGVSMLRPRLTSALVDLERDH